MMTALNLLEKNLKRDESRLNLVLQSLQKKYSLNISNHSIKFAINECIFLLKENEKYLENLICDYAQFEIKVNDFIFKNNTVFNLLKQDNY